MIDIKKQFLGATLLMFFILMTKICANDFYVNSLSTFLKAHSAAQEGDRIVWKNGTYSDINAAVSKNNIQVIAEYPGSVIFNGSSSFYINGSYNVFSGFQFISGYSNGIVITVNGNYNQITQLNFDNYTAQKYISLIGQYDEISYCNFKNKPASAPIGNLIHISPDGIVPNYAKIRYCSFQNMTGNGGDNGNECIRIANGAQSAYSCRTIVEYCYFENTGMGDSEVISVKCRENIIRYCTNVNNQKGNFCFRNGDDNVAYGNYFINAGGIRIKEANNIYCYNNYFQNCGDAQVTAPIKYVYISPNLKNINIVHNTFIGGTPIELDANAVGNTWANNIFQKANGNIFKGNSTGIVWKGNIYDGTLGIQIDSGAANKNPQLITNAEGYLNISNTSPAVNSANPQYPEIIDIPVLDDDPFILFDITGRARPSVKHLKDVGCNELIDGIIKNRPLKLSDVGPEYLRKQTGIEGTLKNSNIKKPLQNYPNPFNPVTVINYFVEKDNRVNLKIYDLLGKEVSTLVDEIKQPGNYSVPFNAYTDSKITLVSGVYICHLQIGNSLATHKMILTK